MNRIQMEKRHWLIVDSILKKYDYKFYVFGSRAKKQARSLSDLDLCIKEPISKSDLREIKSMLEDSDLPYKVDLVLWDEISPEFRQKIEKDLIAFNE